MKILVTGANGYIGSKVVKKLCDLNVEVIATDFNNSNILSAENNRLNPLIGLNLFSFGCKGLRDICHFT